MPRWTGPTPPTESKIFSHDLFAQPLSSLKTHRWVKVLVQAMGFYNSGSFESSLIIPHYHSKALSAKAAHGLFPLPPEGTTGDGCTTRLLLQNQTLSKASADRQKLSTPLSALEQRLFIPLTKNKGTSEFIPCPVILKNIPTCFFTKKSRAGIHPLLLWRGLALYLFCK